jgi:hypothetical protein
MIPSMIPTGCSEQDHGDFDSVFGGSFWLRRLRRFRTSMF